MFKKGRLLGMIKIEITYNSYEKEEEKIILEIVDLLERRIQENLIKGKELGIEIDYKIS